MFLFATAKVLPFSETSKYFAKKLENTDVIGCFVVNEIYETSLPME